MYKTILISLLTLLSIQANADDSMDFSYIDYNIDDNHLSHPIKADVHFSTGKFSEIEQPIFKHDDLPSHKDNYQYFFIAPNFFATLPVKFGPYSPEVAQSIEVKAPNQITFNIKSDNSDKSLTYHVEFTAEDISNIDLNNKKYQFNLDLFNLNKSRFPPGSQCYFISKTSPSFEHFRFNSEDWQMLSNSSTIEDALLSYQNSSLILGENPPQILNYNNFLNLNIINAGEDNQYRVAHFDTGSGEYDYIAWVEYNNRVYSAVWDKPKSNNITSEQDIINCEFYNKIAIDYIVKQIKKYGTLQSESLAEIMSD